ncbi:hypothetical protein CH373_17745 [Leptospira perolatii]|uniref:Uncharacterized protein n=2 Tax=Leptospira perolatii TaxID=2023191 RepID=A0A2M9ZII0_9LEPT|nr:hypothetical protein CH360_17320 [Leptospira perolatii]PJZ71763.1 hypothetical protein CH373_17745 [Leptospira perolatii]
MKNLADFIQICYMAIEAGFAIDRPQTFALRFHSFWKAVCTRHQPPAQSRVGLAKIASIPSKGIFSDELFRN